ncbi:hypothetical protein E2562_013627 [Oryza meyeriana var. granulata]|uniref:F-box domain-containing protein n=1 Tax=Oryza meyeriana var. granulata TaxID=110450 RepID=A0A6G1F817_9ORYZ|nr:hypothetical protein E2562_013627 [Oryza meyeriana var. granulata]
MAWVDLPDECLAGILRHLPCLLDHAMFSGVCTRWRTIAGQNLPLMQSWVTTVDIPRIDIPASRWNRGPAMLNLYAGEQVNLLSSLRDNNPCVRNINLIHTVILSSYYAAAIVSGKPNIVFWRHGMNYWTPLMLKGDVLMKKWKKLLPKDPIEDVIFCVGPLGEGFYEDLLLYKPRTDDKHGELMMSSMETYMVHRNPRPTMPGPGEVLARCLVQTRLPGELLMVIRFVSTEKATVVFDSWKKLTFDTLTNRTIFLGRGCSVVFDMWNPCPLYIYFLDDESARFDGAGTSTSPQVENPFPCVDTG